MTLFFVPSLACNMIFALCTKLCDNKRQRTISSKIFFCGGLNSIALQVLKAAFLMNVEAAYYPYILKFGVVDTFVSWMMVACHRVLRYKGCFYQTR